MNEDLSSIDILKNFAKQTKRKCIYEEKQYPSNTIPPYNHFLRKVYIPNKQDGLIYYVAFQDSKSVGENAVFSDVFVEIPIQKSIKISIQKRDILDKINPFRKNDCLKTGANSFDSKTNNYRE